MSESRNQFAGTLLLVLTVAAVIAGVLSFDKLRSFPLHDDGVTWVDQKGSDGQTHVVAEYIAPNGPGDKADIHLGDRLLQIGSFPIQKALDVPQALWEIPTAGPDQVHPEAAGH